MEYETVSPEDMGRALRGIGVNLLTRDVPRLAAILAAVTGARIFRQSVDFAVVEHQGAVMQLHRDPTFAGNPIYGLLPESGPRGAGAQLYFFGTDPDAGVQQARELGLMVLEDPRDKPHGLREATVLSDEGYALTLAKAIYD